MVSRICREPGVTVISMLGWTTRSLRTAAGMARSSNEELTDDPTQTWATSAPASCLTGTTLPGEWGFAISGSSSGRSTTSTSP
jgi:hypothetical protein